MTLANKRIEFGYEQDEHELDQELTLEQLNQVVGGHQDDGGEYTIHHLSDGGDVIGNQAGYVNGAPAPKPGSGFRIRL